ncbi:MAG TPA: c-type cytochrome [Chitinophagaceae bacterium]|jgi:mono/diheme cytochrome c family protein|nr:c-type cytochrome [Chitinophagaceae bacterium]
MDVNSLYKTSWGKLAVSFFLSLTLLFFTQQVSFAAGGAAPKGDPKAGQTLFQTNCASCHNPIKPMTGPALQGVSETIPGGMDWIYDWVHNSSKVIASGDKYANNLFNTWGHVQMTHFPQLSNTDIDDIIAYVNAYEAPGAPQAKTGVSGEQPAASSGNSLLFGILTLVLALLALILLQVNSNLRKLANDKEGVANPRPIPFYRNKRNIFVLVIILFLLAGYFLVDAATTVGYSKNYQPKQPIFFSHKVHAGINQINCLYCHAGAEKSRYSMIPSPNVCMNCHKVIDHYTGNEFHNADGKIVDGTAEIHKLYDYVGWDPKTKKYTKPGRPIEWVQIHNLPDYVYFNHSQHVKVGQVQCQTCHGPIQDENEVYQYATLGMGWCINCHRTTKVQFTTNGYYTIFTKYEKEMKMHQIDSVTVEMQGGTSCNKCHY